MGVLSVLCPIFSDTSVYKIHIFHDIHLICTNTAPDRDARKGDLYEKHDFVD
jgi:hypothetical protein